MKTLTKRVLLLVLVGAFFTACEKEETNPAEDNSTQISTITKFKTTNQKLNGQASKTEHWDGDINHDCSGVGKNCAVITPSSALSNALIAAVVTGNYQGFFDTHGNVLDLESDLVQGLSNNELKMYPITVDELEYFRIGEIQ